MRFEWDDEKRIENLGKHGLDFIDAQLIFENETVTVSDDRFDYGENRFYTLGLLRGIVVVLSHTESDEILRVISFRKAGKDEEQIYFTQIRD